MTPSLSTALRGTFRRLPSRAFAAALFALALLFGGASPLQAETRGFNMWWVPEGVTVGAHETDSS